VAVVEAFDAPNAASDLLIFSAQFGLPAPNPQTFRSSMLSPRRAQPAASSRAMIPAGRRR
jgi:hypothetical protein